MRFVSSLSESNREQLTAQFKYHDSHSVRRRAHSILLSADGFTIDEITRIYQIHRDTVGTTFDRWEREGIEGLIDGYRSGRPPKLSESEADEAIKSLKEDPRSIKKALATTNEKTGKQISEWTLKRIAKRAELRWKRMRKSVKGKRNQAEFERVQSEITILHEQEAAGELAIYYFDESGFNLIPEVPYAWQAVGETIGIPSSLSEKEKLGGEEGKGVKF